MKMKISKNKLNKLIAEEMRKLVKEDEAGAPMYGDMSQGVPPVPGEPEQDVNAVAQQVLELLANVPHDDAVDILNAVAIELDLVAPEEPEPEKRPIGFVRESLKKRLVESSYEEIMRIRDSGDYEWRDMEYEVVDLMEKMQTFPARDVIDIMYDALDAEDRQDMNFWHMMLSNGGHLYQALDALKAGQSVENIVSEDIIMDEINKVLSESGAWAPESTLPSNTMDDGGVVPKYGESKQDKQELLQKILSAIDEADLQELEKLSTMLDAGMRGIRESVLGGMAAGAALTISAAGIYQAIKQLMDEPEPAAAGRRAFPNDSALNGIRDYVEKNIAKAEVGDAGKRRRPPGRPPADNKQALAKKLYKLKAARGIEQEREVD